MYIYIYYNHRNGIQLYINKIKCAYSFKIMYITS